MGLDNLTLFAVNAIIVYVMAAAFLIAGRGRAGEPYWRSWFLSNMLLASALVIFMLGRDHFPRFVLATAPNGLLVLGFGMRWRAAREFCARRAPGYLAWGPAALYVALCIVPAATLSYPGVYTLTSLHLALLSGVVAWEFWRDRADRLPSRHGLVVVYGIMAASFLMRTGQGVLEGSGLDPTFPYVTLLQVHLLIAAFFACASSAFALSIAYERSAARLTHAATHDSLTGLLNRGAFEAIMDKRFAQAGPEPFAIVLLDIDHFKTINDKHGHAAGDAALRACSATCTAQLRPGDAMARIGGEEFAVLLDRVTPEEAIRVSERMLHAVRDMRVDGRTGRFGLTISAGLCHSTTVPARFDAMMRVADERLYDAKREGRNRVARSAA